MFCKANLLGAMSVCGALSAGALAQPASANSAAAVVSKNDTDKDGTLSIAELKSKAALRLKKLID